MRWFLNDEVEHVYAITRNYLKSEDDYLIVHLHFKNGADAIEECSWTAPPLSIKYCFAQMEIRGTKGAIEVNSSNMNVDIFTEANAVSSPGQRGPGLELPNTAKGEDKEGTESHNERDGGHKATTAPALSRQPQPRPEQAPG